MDQTTTSKIGQQTGKQTEIKKDKKTHNEIGTAPDRDVGTRKIYRKIRDKVNGAG